MVDYEKFLSDLSAVDKDKLNVDEVQEIAKKYKFEYDSKTGKFKGPNGKSHDLFAANKQVADLAKGKTIITTETDLSDIITSKNIVEFSENVFGDSSEAQLAENLLEKRIKQKVDNSSSAFKPDPTKKSTKDLVAGAGTGRANPTALENVLDENTISQLDTSVENVENMDKKLTELIKKMDKAIAASFEDRESLEEIKKTLDKDGGRIQELANKTGKGLMVLLASFIAYVSIDELVDELSGCFVTTKKDGKIISKCKLDKFTCNPYKKEGVYPLCSSLQDFYDASSTDPSCLKNGKNYNDDDYFTSNECQDKGTDNDGTCNLCNSNNKCFTQNGEDGLTYEYSCVKVNAADALGYVMGGLINLVRDTTSAVFSAKWLWYMLYIVGGIMVVYLVFAYLRSRITGETSHFRYKR